MIASWSIFLAGDFIEPTFRDDIDSSTLGSLHLIGLEHEIAEDRVRAAYVSERWSDRCSECQQRKFEEAALLLLEFVADPDHGVGKPRGRVKVRREDDSRVWIEEAIALLTIL